jgi:hypothetical protein
MVFTMEMMVEKTTTSKVLRVLQFTEKGRFSSQLRRGRQNDHYFGELTGYTKNETGVGKNAHSITGDIVNWQIVTGEKALSLVIYF